MPVNGQKEFFMRVALSPSRVVLVASLLLAAAAAFASGDAPVLTGEGRRGFEDLDIWNDPTFQKQFLGSYGFQAELEPRVTVVEREKMEKILELMQASDLEGAVGELEKILKGDGRRGSAEASAIFDFTLANIHFQQENLDEAARYYRHAIEKFPSFRRAHKNLGLIHVRNGDFEDATSSLSRVIDLGGGDGLTYGLLGYAYSSSGQFVAAESAYRSALLLQPDTLDWKLGLTQSVFKQQKYRETKTLCEELINGDPERAEYWLLQANAYIGLGQAMKAAENYEILQRMGHATVQSLLTLGDIYVNESLWDLAGRAYRLALEKDPAQNVENSLRRVEVLAQRGALDQARILLARVKELQGQGMDDTSRMKMLKLEARMAVAEGESGGAVGVLEEIVALDPLDGEALILLGQHYARSDEPERAIFYFERAESLEEFEAEAKIRHAQVLVGQSKYGEALPLLKRANELEPRDDVARYMDQVERIARQRR
jgi:tetratricopeptide (TPR) repeat protein